MLLLVKLPATVSPVVAAFVGALNTPELLRDPTDTLNAPLVNVRLLLGMEKEPLTMISCDN